MSDLLASAFTEKKKNYEKLSRIGGGAYGDVWKARDTLNKDKIIALKMIRLPSEEDGIPPNVIREVALLKKLGNYNHENVVRLLDICTIKDSKDNNDKLYLVFEHIEQDLATYISRAPPSGLSSDQIKNIMSQLMDGISFIHANLIEHRDLKPQNVLITNSGQVKIADFGLARLYKPHALQTSLVVTLWYRSPEVILASREGYASAIDIWSAGCIFAELVRRQPLFKGTSEHHQLVLILEKIGSPPESEWPEGTQLEYRSFAGYTGVDFEELFPELDHDAIDLLKKMLIFNPDKRITAKEALKHTYLIQDQQTPAPLQSSTETVTINNDQQTCTSGSSTFVVSQRQPTNNHPSISSSSSNATYWEF